MVTTPQRSRVKQRVTRQSQAVVRQNGKRKKRLTFQDYDDKLTSLRKIREEEVLHQQRLTRW